MDPAQRESARRTHGRSVVLRLRDLDAGSLSLAGGKAANLGELIGAGLPVPDGFCVTTDAYLELTAAADLGELVAQLAGAAPAAQERAAEPARLARERILSTAMPAHVA